MTGRLCNPVNITIEKINRGRELLDTIESARKELNELFGDNTNLRCQGIEPCAAEPARATHRRLGRRSNSAKGVARNGAPKPKRVMSAAGRARIAAAAKARWKRFRAEKALEPA